MSTKLSQDVRAFHSRFGHPVRERPTVPSAEEMRFRLKLITEEYLELLDAATAPDEPGRVLKETFGKMVRHYLDEAKIGVDLPELVDAMGDLDYVVEGTRVVCGVDGAPVHAEIHHANLMKDPVYVRAKDSFHTGHFKPDAAAKPTKPKGWKAPDIAAELVRQGWVPVLPPGARGA